MECGDKGVVGVGWVGVGGGKWEVLSHVHPQCSREKTSFDTHASGENLAEVDCLIVREPAQERGLSWRGGQRGQGC